ncbi:hypothetical protein HETIRDRAFT_435456 [Heterobasidion irregulare TC 32-1]|uniref:Uncharacterized protein n=1 Tax=Heterobasidion irregulare (strain TC 32-1) TaxID=747525 RepID=W4K185_HETIT|nr:uncharacterized protein HETIRDRAFT_435456 [Heterobasidion irregulare TC 32-1]ETW78836.1 hypothetical protein HETIRDRAFT_435456 [Heterobasidion irregulare TC 32-1]
MAPDIFGEGIQVHRHLHIPRRLEPVGAHNFFDLALQPEDQRRVEHLCPRREMTVVNLPPAARCPPYARGAAHIP